MTPKKILFDTNASGILKQTVWVLLALGLASPIAPAPVYATTLTTRMYMATMENNTSQGFTPDVTDMDHETVLEQYTFAIVESPAHGVASVVTASQAGQVHMAWDKVDAPGLAGYSVYYVLIDDPADHDSSCLDALGDADTVEVSATETVARVSDLEPGETYCFGVKAYDDAGRESAFSNTLRYQLPQVGQLVYTPEPGFNGIDSFSYRATDRRGTSMIGTAHVTVLPINDAEAPAPVAAYGFDEGKGSVAFDTSEYRNDGIISGATWTPQGRFGNALWFDGIDDQVTVEDHASLHLTSEMTLVVWVYPTAIPGDSTWQPLVLKEGHDIEGYYLYLYDDGISNQPLSGIYTNDWQDVVGETSLSLDTWTHLATTYDGSILRLYINGIEVASRPRSGMIRRSSGPLRIGGTIWGAYFQGRIDEVRIYDRALHVEEIWADMNFPVGSTAK